MLEEQVAPLYYALAPDGLPRGWIARVKHAMQTLAWRFNADRMLRDYAETAYIPAAGGVSADMPGRARP